MRDMLDSNSVFEHPVLELTAEDLYNKGEAAKQLLASGIFRDAFREAEFDLAQEMLREEYPILDPEGHILGYRDPAAETYAAKRAVLGLRAMEKALRAFIADGEEARTVLMKAGVLPADD